MKYLKLYEKWEDFDFEDFDEEEFDDNMEEIHYPFDELKRGDKVKIKDFDGKYIIVTVHSNDDTMLSFFNKKTITYHNILKQKGKTFNRINENFDFDEFDFDEEEFDEFDFKVKDYVRPKKSFFDSIGRRYFKNRSYKIITINQKFVNVRDEHFRRHLLPRKYFISKFEIFDNGWGSI